VEASEGLGRSRWRGAGPTLGFRLCQALRHLLAGEGSSPRWSRRAQARLAELREEHAFVHPEGPTLLSRPPSGAEWWTFAGTRTNATLAGELSRLCGCRVDHDALAVTVEGAEGTRAVEAAVHELGSWDPSSMAPAVEERALEGLKFAQCLPKELALATLASRLRDVDAVRVVLAQPTRFVSGL
jgi:ATP-dependent Lhr-like helicase